MNEKTSCLVSFATSGWIIGLGVYLRDWPTMFLFAIGFAGLGISIYELLKVNRKD